MKQPTARLTFLSALTEYRCLTVRQSLAAGLASEQMTRRYGRELVKNGLVSVKPFQAMESSGRPENLILPTPKGFKAVGVNAKPLEQRLFLHQYYLNWCRIKFDDLKQFAVRPTFQVRSIGGFWPDGTLVLRSEKLDKSLLFFLEVDMGTESISGELAAKRGAYRELFSSRTYKEIGQYFNGFRVLFVFSDKSRLRAFLRLKRDLYSFIWSTDFQSLNRSGAGAAIWQRGAETSEQFSILGSLQSVTTDSEQTT